MKSKTELAEVLLEIEKMYPDIRTELDYETPFQFLVAVILSAQTTDKQVNKTTPELFSRIREPRDIETLTPEEVERMVQSVNYYRNKAKFIRAAGIMLDRDFSGVIPNDLALLQKLPGVGIKTAKVVLAVLYKGAHVGVDTHIHRVANRIGIVETKTPEQTDKALDSLFTYEQKLTAHHPIVLFGRYHCTARNPKCSSCPIRKRCDYSRKNNST